ncbi:PhoP regulatory network protein YrbL [Marinobacter daqiaonensis]|uniref:PhoP regulatory network protein YrbL n=1 Tax=Marinobacter daqiaonensis TaxID=650891 RepID=A0A1I6K2B8_9GAMM|nr:YrbL family protein [Marinobacter daqiaonensis]SFR85405.1 PhoP regulatory network protein YrbL [Marinobacter daqiaonensis]
MIDLRGHVPFASGSNRHCYRHPDQPDRCLKVIRPENIEARFRRQPAWKKALGRQRLDDNRQEILAHQQTAIRRLLSSGQADLAWQHLPRFYGQVPTTLGLANESELILEEDGMPAATLESWLIMQGVTPTIQPAIERFCDWLRTTGILTRNLLPHNLVVTRRGGSPELILVDGLGAPAVPSRLAAIPQWRNRYTDRRIRRFRKRIQWEVTGRQTAWEKEQHL